jgi:carbamoyl-phosphate synthase large subunit
MPAPLKLLLTSAGRRVELLRCFRADAAALGLDFEVHAADLHPHLSAACAEADHSIEVPRCDSPHYADALLDYCCAQGIGLLVPTIDTELLPLARAAGASARPGYC